MCIIIIFQWGMKLYTEIFDLPDKFNKNAVQGNNWCDS